MERHNGDLRLSKLQAQPHRACHAAAATSHPPREIPDPGMPTVTFQQGEHINRGRMAASAGREILDGFPLVIMI